MKKLAIPDIVKHGKNGLLSKPFDEYGMADNMIELLGNLKLQKKMSRQSLAIVKNYSVDNTVDKVEKIYRRLIL